MHLVFHRGFIIWGPPIVEGTMFFLFYVWPPLMFLLLPGFAFVLVAVVKAVRSERGLRLLGLHKNRGPVNFYCGTGWRSSVAFVLAYMLGWDARNYDDGWFGWSCHMSLPACDL